VGLPLKQSRAVRELAEALYDFLPGSGSATWRGHVSFKSVADKVGVADFWQPGSKLPMLTSLLERTLEFRRGRFEPLVVEIVRCGLTYRQKQGNPVKPEEIDKVLNFSVDILRAFGFEQFELYLSTRPPKRVGREEDWDVAEAALEDTLKRSGIKYQVNAGDGAFYGPKIDLLVNDAIGRPWQLSTIQFDFNLPERFDLSYIGEDGAQHRPFMIHRALMGSVERFFGVLLEHHGGALPVWLSPVQAMLIPIADRHVEYCKQVQAQLKAAGLRVATNIPRVGARFGSRSRRSW